MITKPTTLLRKPGAWVPMVLPLAALAFVLAHVVVFGVVNRQDEGAPARLFQLFMAFEALAIASFAVRWLPQAPRPALAIVALQLLLAAVPVGTIILLEM